MVRLNNMFTLLNWFFTPVKLYGGDGGDSGDSGGDSGGWGDSAFGDYSDYGFEEEFGDPSSSDSGGGSFQGSTSVDWGSMVDTSTPMSSASTQLGQGGLDSFGGFNTPSIDTVSDSAFSSTVAAMDAFSAAAARNEAFSYGEFGIQGTLGSSWSVSTNTSSVGAGFTDAGDSFSFSSNEGYFGTTASYDQLSLYNNGSVYSELDYGTFFDTEVTTTAFQDPDTLGWSVSQYSVGAFADRTFGGATNADATLQNAKTYSGLSLFGLDEIAYDTHYESAHNQEMSLLGEFALDIGEMIVGGKYYNTPQGVVDRAYNIDTASDMLGNISSVFRIGGLLGIAALPALTKNMTAQELTQYQYNTPYQGFAGFKQADGIFAGLAALGAGSIGNISNPSGIMQSIDGAGNLIDSIKSISSVNPSYNNSTTTAMPLSSPTLSPASRYASMALLGQDAGRADYAWDAMNTFRVDYTQNSTVQDSVGINSITKDY